MILRRLRQKCRHTRLDAGKLLPAQRADLADSDFLIRNYKGHGLARVIEAILRAKGFTVYRSKEGADHGVDLLACADVGDVSAYDAVALGCPAMGAEELEDGEFLPMLESIEAALPGKKIALFGSYGWGDGEWMRTWEGRCAEKGITLAADSVIVNEAPDDDGLAKCKALGEALVS